MILGSGQYSYRVAEGWGMLPPGWTLGDVGGVGVDSNDRVYVFNRGPHPMIVFDAHGSFIASWGEGVFTRPHGVHVGADDYLYLTDDGDHTVRKCTCDGEVVIQIGAKGVPAAFMSGQPFSRCTHTALSPDGDIYVSDGYSNARVHKYSPDGKLLLSWGEPGSGPGQFNLPHNICCDGDGWVYVADRENHRIQVFDGKGRFETQWNNIHRPCALFMSRGRCPLCYMGEIGPELRFNRRAPNLGPRLSVWSPGGKLLARLGAGPAGVEPGEFLAPHGIAVDSRGDIYVAEVSITAWPSLFPETPVPSPIRSLQKLVKVVA